MSEASRSTIVNMTGPMTDAALPQVLRILGDSGLRLLSLRQSREFGGACVTAVLGGELPASESETLGVLAREWGVDITLRVGDAQPGAACICLTILGDRTQTAVAELLDCARAHGFVGREIRPLGGRLFLGVDVLLETIGGAPVETVPEGLRRAILAQSAKLGVDVALQKNDFFRTNRRLLCMDVDSTFVKGEFIDEMASLAGIKDQVAAITARAMRGELDFPAALRERVRLLKGLPMEKALNLCEHFELTPGAEDLVRSLKRLGIRVGLVSGGFDFFVEKLKAKFELDFAFANQLEVKDGHLTGEVIGTIVDGQRKAQVLRDMAKVYELDLRQTIAAGDGANDMFMLEAAGLGIAYQAKPRLLEFADACFNHHDRLDTMLYLMGFDAPEVQRNACTTGLDP